MRRLHNFLAGVVLAVCSCLSIPAAFSQAVTPTADQLDMFRSLAPDQQQSILKAISGGGGLGGLTSGSQRSNGDRDGNNGDQSDRTGGNPDRNRQNATTDDNQDSATPVLKGEDSLIIEVDFHLAPRPVSTAALAAQFPGTPGAASLALPPGSGATGLAGGGASPNLQQPQEPQTDKPEKELTDEETAHLNELIRLIRSRNPYKLSRDGVLYLPGFAPIPLAGLIEDLATLRLKVEPALHDLDVRVTKLPLKKTGPEGLKPFGYDLFQRAPSTFAPVTNVPVPADYTLGPGDELDVQLYGNQNRNLQLVVGRDGRINFPELGPIHVGGLRFSEAKADIEARVSRQIIGSRGSVSMGDTRSIRVFVLGDANRPGSYTISGLGTITSALFAAGGIKPIGSLRDIQLKRQGEVVRHLDLYAMLIHGNTSDDAKLLAGDVIFVPSVGATVSVAGEVRRPAIYETRGQTSLNEIMDLAGGLTPEADTANVMLTRIDEQHRRVVLKFDPTAATARSEFMRDGDLLRVPRLRPTLDSGVLVSGHVYTSGAVAFRDGMRLSDVIRSVDELQPNADIHYLLIRRESPVDRRISVFSADLEKALASPGSRDDIALQRRDQITVFDLQSGRDRVIQPVLDELRLQSNLAQPNQVVRIDGRIKVPGEYPLEPGMKVSDLIRAGGSLQEAAYGGAAELVRYKSQDGESRKTDMVEIDLAAVLSGDPKADLVLQPFDLLSIKELPQWSGQENVTLLGEVRFPGKYAIKRGETLRSVVARAGGLTDFAFPEGSVFTRAELRKREQEQLDGLSQKLQHDLAVLALQAVAASQGQGGGSAITVGQSLLSQLKATKAVGRLVIDLPRALHGDGSDSDIILRGGDQLLVPKVQQEVTVIGEVASQTSHLYRAGYQRDDYIALSGGVTRRADRGRIYVVRANGSVVAAEGSRWFERSDMSIKRGDTVVVPLDTERLPPLPFWQAVTGIIYNVAIAAAAVHSF